MYERLDVWSAKWREGVWVKWGGSVGEVEGGTVGEVGRECGSVSFYVSRSEQ